MNDELLTRIINKTKEIFKYDTYNRAINQADTKIEVGYDVDFEAAGADDVDFEADKVMESSESSEKLTTPSYTLKKVIFSNTNLYVVVTDTFVMYRNYILGNWETKLSYEGWGQFLEM